MCITTCVIKQCKKILGKGWEVFTFRDRGILDARAGTSSISSFPLIKRKDDQIIDTCPRWLSYQKT